MSTCNIDNVETIEEGLEEAQEKRVYFRCPKCGHDLLLHIVKSTFLVEGVVSLERWKKNGRRFWYPLILGHNEDCPQELHCSCGGCGYTLTDEKGNEIRNEDQLTDWLMANCPQQNEETGEQESV